MTCRSLWNKTTQFINIGFSQVASEYGYHIVRLFTTCSESGWKLKSDQLFRQWTRFMFPMELVEPIAKLVYWSWNWLWTAMKVILLKEYDQHKSFPHNFSTHTNKTIWCNCARFRGVVFGREMDLSSSTFLCFRLPFHVDHINLMSLPYISCIQWIYHVEWA